MPNRLEYFKAKKERRITELKKEDPKRLTDRERALLDKFIKPPSEIVEQESSEDEEEKEDHT
jgi:hypothetical protein